MATCLRSRRDITLDVVHAVAWQGGSVALAPDALELMDRRYESFAQLVAARVREDPAALIYGVTSAPGDLARTALSAEQEDHRPTQLHTAMSFGQPAPRRVVRAILLARLANMVDGHAAVRGRTAQAVADMLELAELPEVPVQGNGGSGEILPLGCLFFDLSTRLSLTTKERMALVNGSPCAAALTADAALAGRGRLELAEAAFALVADAAGAPDEHFAPELEELWGDPHETTELQTLRRLLAGSERLRQPHQASVSLRILPRVLGAARRAQVEAERAATVSLSSVTDNPVYVAPDAERPGGAVYSTGGYHNAQAAPAMDGLAFAHADLCQLAQRLTDHMFTHPQTGPLIGGDEYTAKPLHMVQNGWAEEARSLAQPTLLSLGAFGQNDVPALNFLAWHKTMAIGNCLDAALAVLVAVASQVLHRSGRTPAPGLRPFVAHARDFFPPVDKPRPLGRDLQKLTYEFARQVFR
ncbi:MAG: aromatic amino acid lyase [Solirubrobacteraceae bacterium]